MRPSWDWMAVPLFMPFIRPDGSSHHYSGDFLQLGAVTRGSLAKSFSVTVFVFVTSAVFICTLEGGTGKFGRWHFCRDTCQGIARTPFSHDVMTLVLTGLAANIVLLAAVQNRFCLLQSNICPCYSIGG